MSKPAFWRVWIGREWFDFGCRHKARRFAPCFHIGLWEARYCGRWRAVHAQVNRTFIVYRGERITIQIWGV